MEQQHIWIDTDLSVGKKRHLRPGFCDVDDGYAVLQLMYAPTIRIEGISAVFGNTLIDDAYELCRKMSDDFSQGSIPVFRGALGPISLQNVETNEAVEALAAALRIRPLRVVAIGPATNIGLLVLKYPELKGQLTEVVLVAGRRTAMDYFKIGNKGAHAPDLNFDLDNNAFRVLLQNKVPLVLCPFEISNKVWIKKEDLKALSNGKPLNEWLVAASYPWLDQWLEQGEDGFNPFDVLASHYILHPEDLLTEKLNARLEIHPNDMVPEPMGNHYKEYLLCDQSPGFPVTYCYDVVSGYHDKLMASLL